MAALKKELKVQISRREFAEMLSAELKSDGSFTGFITEKVSNGVYAYVCEKLAKAAQGLPTSTVALGYLEFYSYVDNAYRKNYTNDVNDNFQYSNRVIAVNVYHELDGFVGKGGRTYWVRTFNYRVERVWGH